MKPQFLEVDTIIIAELAAPWANYFIKTEGGYLAFECEDDCRNFFAFPGEYNDA